MLSTFAYRLSNPPRVPLFWPSMALSDSHAALLHPLAAHHLGMVATIYNTQPPEMRRYHLHRALSQTDSGLAVAESELEQVFRRLEHSAPTLLGLTSAGQPLCDPRRTSVVVPEVDECPWCNIALTEGALSPARSLTYADGLVDILWRKDTCGRCSRRFSACWAIGTGSGGAAYLVSPLKGCFFQCLLHPRSGSVAFIHADLLSYYEKLLAHSHSSFEAIHMALEDQRGFRDKHLYENLLTAWMLSTAIRVLWPSQEQRLRELPWHIERHARSSTYTEYQALELLLREQLGARVAREHTCAKCNTDTVVVDAVQGVAPRCCMFPNVTTEKYVGTDTELCWPCGQMPHGPFAFCRDHLAKTGPSPITCAGGREYSVATRDVNWWRDCDTCAQHIPGGASFYACGGTCAHDMCVACFARSKRSSWAGEQQQTEPPPPPLSIRHDPLRELTPITLARPVAGAEMPRPSAEAASTDLDTDINPCGIDKETAEPPRKKRLGGILAAVLPCGTVVGLLPIPKGESLTQVHALLGEVRRYRRIRFVVYDNACALAHFARRASRATRTHICRLLAAITFVLDRFHIRNHTACLQPDHHRYMPEVDVYAHAELQGVNTAICESFNAWLDRFAYSVHSMHPAQFRVFILLLAHLWNTFIVPRGVADVRLVRVLTAHGNLRRVRTSVE